MKICLYSSQLQALAILEAPDKLRAGQRVGISPLPSLEYVGPSTDAAVSVPTAIAEIKALHTDAGSATWIAVCLRPEDDRVIETQLQTSTKLILRL